MLPEGIDYDVGGVGDAQQVTPAPLGQGEGKDSTHVWLLVLSAAEAGTAYPKTLVSVGEPNIR